MSHDEGGSTVARPVRDEAFEAVYREHHDHLVRLARRWLFDDGAEQVAQEVLLAHWEQPDRFDGRRGSLRTFLRINCRHRAIDAFRSDAARRGRDDRYGRRNPSVVEAEYDGARDAIAAALLKLPLPQREAIVLAFYGDLTYREVAVRLGAPEGTVKTRIRSGLAALRSTMEPVDPLVAT